MRVGAGGHAGPPMIDDFRGCPGAGAAAIHGPAAHATSSCNEHGTIYAISSDFGDRMTTQSMGLMVLLREYF